jgi:hypothetical protein
MEDRFITIRVELEIPIDKNLIKKAGLDPDTAKELIEHRVKSASHRISSWITETIQSILLACSSTREENEREQYKPMIKSVRRSRKIKILIYEKRGIIYFKPERKIKTLKKRKYLKVNDNLIPLVLSRKGAVLNPDAIEALRRLMSGRREIHLVITGRTRDGHPILEVDKDEEDKDSSIQRKY